MTGASSITLTSLLIRAVQLGASDLHIKPGSPPAVRIGGRIRLLEMESLSHEETQRLVTSMMTEEQANRLYQELELELGLAPEGLPRFRVNCHFERGGFSASFRALQTKIPTFENLGLPSSLAEIALKPRGLVLVTGATGSGKTTTLAAMVGHINAHRAATIVTIEDPIEYVHTDRQAFIRQREVGLDTRSFPEALRRVLRQDPDVIVIGELRDLETISTALTAAETGHLVIATLHTNSAEATINRIIDVYPPFQQRQVRIQLAATIEAVIAQQLIPRADGRGVALAYELMLGLFAIRRLVREEKTYSIATYMQSGKSQGMVTMDSTLVTLYRQGLISFEEAVAHAYEPEEFQQLV
jgi:twitching motility protein PilT